MKSFNDYLIEAVSKNNEIKMINLNPKQFRQIWFEGFPFDGKYVGIYDIYYVINKMALNDFHKFAFELTPSVVTKYIKLIVDSGVTRMTFENAKFQFSKEIKLRNKSNTIIGKSENINSKLMKI